MEEKVLKVCEDLKKMGVNFLFVIEDGDGIHSNHSVKGNSKIRDLVRELKK